MKHSSATASRASLTLAAVGVLSTQARAEGADKHAEGSGVVTCANGTPVVSLR
jgi:hypothetical protein